jgi:hypothetical protein
MYSGLPFKILEAVAKSTYADWNTVASITLNIVNYVQFIGSKIKIAQEYYKIRD